MIFHSHRLHWYKVRRYKFWRPETLHKVMERLRGGHTTAGSTVQCTACCGTFMYTWPAPIHFEVFRHIVYYGCILLHIYMCNVYVVDFLHVWSIWFKGHINTTSRIIAIEALARDGSELGKENATAALWALLMAQERQINGKHDEGDNGENAEDDGGWREGNMGKHSDIFWKKWETHQRNMKLWPWKARFHTASQCFFTNVWHWLTFVQQESTVQLLDLEISGLDGHV